MSEKPLKSIEQIIKDDGRYPMSAVDFVREGLGFTVDAVHKQESDYECEDLPPEQRPAHHVSGAQLCHGLRELAHKQWGLMARRVLNYWNVNSTRDFGEIVFLMVNNGWMQKQPHDSVEDFDDVYDFQIALDRDYEITLEA